MRAINSQFLPVAPMHSVGYRRRDQLSREAAKAHLPNMDYHSR